MSNKRVVLVTLLLAATAVTVWQFAKRSTVSSPVQAHAQPAPGRPPSAEGKKPVANTADTGVAKPPTSANPIPGQGLASAAANAAGGTKPAEAKGRSARYAATMVPPLQNLQRGSEIVIPLPGGEQATGVVNLALVDPNGVVRVGGSLTGSEAGSFSLSGSARGIGGRVLMPDKEVAYVIMPAPGGLMRVHEMPLAGVICYPFPREPKSAGILPTDIVPQPRAAAPLLSSRPSATAVLYLVFDGATVTDPDWNAGNTIVAPASTLSNVQITEVWNRVREDYWPFNIDITTDHTRYASAPVGQRMRIIITENDVAEPGAGGVAMWGSFTLAGAPYEVFTSNVPAWVFNSSVNGVAEAISHELGHTLGLDHDGRNPPLTDYSDDTGDYYYGHGNTSSAVGWAPIMGAGYYQNLVQWSKGEYPGATNQEDDIAVVAGTASFSVAELTFTNVTGFIADEAGDSRAAAAVVDVASGSLNTAGIISSAADSDFYSFTVGTATNFNINADPPGAYTKQANLDILLELQDSSGNILASSNPDTALHASISKSLAPGTYYLKVAGVGRTGNAGAGDYGYSNYGSTGQYTLAGTLVAFTPVAPTFNAQPSNQSVSAGATAQFTVAAGGTPAPSYQWQRLPSGSGTWGDLSNGGAYTGATSATLSVSGTTLAMSGDQFRCVATNDVGSATSNAAILTVNPVGPTFTTQPQSQAVTAGTSVTFTASASGTPAPTFQWQKDGVDISGATGSSYTIASVVPGDAGPYRVVATNTEGNATSNTAVLTVNVAPAITLQPSSQTIVEGTAVTFTAAASGTPAPTYQWQRDGVNISGATGASFTIANVVPGNAGAYRVVATNVVGAAISNAAVLTVVPPGPFVTNLSPTRQVFTPGQSMNLSVTATGTGTITYQWIHNGRAIPGANGSNLSVASLLSADCGWYAVLLTDSNGARRSAPIFVFVSPALTQVRGWGTNDNGQTTIPAGLANVLSVDSGGNHSLALKADGTIVGWGYTGLGATTIPGGLADVVAVSAGSEHSLALRADGTVVVWGRNYEGQATVPAGLTDVVTISGGNQHSLALKSDGTVVGWGYNYSGEATAPVGLSGVVSISAGTSYSLALKSDGTVVAWGYNDQGQATVPAGLGNVVAIAAGYSHSMALKADGTVVAWGLNSSGQTSVPAGLTNVAGIAAGYSHSLALKSDGTVVAWGNDSYGQSTGPSDLANAFGISSGANFGIALRNAAGETAPAITTQPASQNLAQTQQATFTVVANGLGTLSYQWRKNGVDIAGATGSSYTIVELVNADAGNYDVVVTNYIGSTTSATAVLTVNPPAVIIGLSPTRQVLFPGQNLNLSVTATGVGPLSYQWTRNGRPITGATGSSYSVPSVTFDHVGWYLVYVMDSNGSKRSAPFFVGIVPDGTPIPPRQLRGLTYYNNATPALTDVLAIASGVGHSLALRSNGSVFTWKLNDQGQTSVPAGLNDAIAIAAGGNSSFALRSDGSLIGWGDNGSGQISVPAGLTDVVAVATGGYHTLALRSDGTVVAWGYNYDGQASVPAGLTDVVAISARGTYSMALKSNGTVVSWGKLINSTAGVPANLTDVIAIAAGETHALALRNNGTVVEWGYYSQNEFVPTTSRPPSLTGVVAIATGSQTSFAVKSDGSVVGWGNLIDVQISSLAELDKVLAVSAGYSLYVALRDAAADTAPIVSIEPASQTVEETQTATWTATVTGAGPWSFQWRRDGVNIPGATAAMLTKTNITVADAGNYDVVVTNYKGSTTSAPVTLSVIPLPPITCLSPIRQMVAPGQTLTLSISATGFGSLSYQWLHNGLPVAGATGATLSVANATPRANGWYYAKVTDSNGTRRSATFFVRVAPAITQIRIVGTYPAELANVPAGLNDVVNIAAGNYHALALHADGTVTSWGANNEGQSTVPAGLTNVVAVAAGSYRSLALKADGTVLGWGITTSAAPAGLSDVVAIAAGSMHSLALKADGTVVAWGFSNNGLINVPAGLSDVVAIAAGYNYSLALKNNGTVVIWGRNEYGTNAQVPAGLNNVTAVAGGYTRTFVIKGDGAVVGWQPQGAVPAAIPGGLVDPQALAQDIAVTSDGRLVVWNSYDAVAVPVYPDIDRTFSVASNGVGFAIRDASADTVPVIVQQPVSQTLVDAQSVVLSVQAGGGGPYAYQWRKNEVNIAGATASTLAFASVQFADAGNYDVVVTNPQGSTTSAVAVLSVNAVPTITGLSAFNQLLAPGQALSLSVTATGTGALGYQWYYNGQLIPGATGANYSPGSVTVQNSGWYHVAVTDSHGTRYSPPITVKVVPLTTQVVTWGSNLNGQNVVPAGLSNAVSIDTHYQTILVLKRDGTVVAWGDNSNGQRNVPTGLVNVVAIAAGSQHSLALKADSTIVAWGIATNGITSVPAGLVNVIAIDAGGDHTLALKNDGTVVAWGGNAAGQCTVPANLYNVVGVAAGAGFSLALKRDGTVAGWGNTTIPAGLSDVIAISATNGHALALRRDGMVFAWGANYNSQTTVPAGLASVSSVAAAWDSSVVLKQNGTVVAWGARADSYSPYPGNISNGLAVAGGWLFWLALVDPSPVTAPVFTTQPVTQAVGVGSNVGFSVTATGTPAPAYQWQRLPAGSGVWDNLSNGGTYFGTITSTLTITGATWAMGGDQFRCVVSNSAGSATSNPATLTILQPLSDFNFDGRPDLIWQNRNTGERGFWLMNGTAVGTYVSLATVNADLQVVGYGDFNADGQADLVWSNLATGERKLWLMNGATMGSEVTLATVGTEWEIAGVADFNGDGKPDIVWQNTISGQRGMWLMNGTTVGTFIEFAVVGTEWQIAATGDFNGDGKPDIVWQNTISGQRGMWLMNGTTVGTFIEFATVGTEWSIMGAADFNGDGHTDIVWQNAISGERGMWIMNGTSVGSYVAFATVGTEWTLGRMPYRRAV
ncbi:MAG: immunoglobulin domain-containing protein, partial [Phycisphaerae bacterium]